MPRLAPQAQLDQLQQADMYAVHAVFSADVVRNGLQAHSCRGRAQQPPAQAPLGRWAIGASALSSAMEESPTGLSSRFPSSVLLYMLILTYNLVFCV
jgi:hypothetical protein